MNHSTPRIGAGQQSLNITDLGGQLSLLLESLPIEVRNPLRAAGLIAAIDIKTIAYQTALRGDASYFDALTLAPGIHTQQMSAELNNGEYPVACAMTATSIVFSVGNQATVAYLQKISKTGHLTTVRVSPLAPAQDILSIGLRLPPSAAQISSLTLATIAVLGAIKDWWSVAAFFVLILARLINIAIVKSRCSSGKEKGCASDVSDHDDDILILLSQDRWVRMRGAPYDIHAVTARPWMRDMNVLESCAASIATLLVHISAIAAFNASEPGSRLLALTLVFSLFLVGRANAGTKELHMFNRVLRVGEEAKGYERRTEMAEALIAERNCGRDWAVRLGLVLSDKVTVSSAQGSSLTVDMVSPLVRV